MGDESKTLKTFITHTKPTQKKGVTKKHASNDH